MAGTVGRRAGRPRSAASGIILAAAHRTRRCSAKRVRESDLEILMLRAVLTAIAIALLAAPAPAGEVRLEYEVKAAFLFNFLKFVEWPPSPGGTPWVICVLGHDPFGDVLDETVRGKIVNGRRVEVRRYSRISDV